MTRKLAAIALAALAVSAAAQPVGPEVRVESGAHDRRNAVVSVTLRNVDASRQYILRNGPTSIPVQIDDRGRGWFIVPEQKAGTSRTFELVEAGPNAAAVTATRQADDVLIAAGTNRFPVLRYVGGAGVLPSPDIKPIFRRGGYLHPVHTPSGKIVTDDYPDDHWHHHGVWFAWTRTVFQGREPDFWNMGAGKARVEFEALENTWNGPIHAGFVARHRYVDLTSGAAIVVVSEQWTTRAFALGGGTRPYHMFDVEVSQRNVTDDPLTLPEYHYGGLGVRGAASFVRLDNVEFLTSEGKDRLTGDGTEARWALIAGGVEGARAGLAVLAHPGNFRAPERLRLHPTDPYLCFAPSRSGPWVIRSGSTHTARYRFIAFDGPPDPAELRRLWVDYAQPPSAIQTR